MKTMHTIAGTLAGSMILTSLVFAAGNAVAQSAAAVKEDQVQTKADDSALARERAQRRIDQKALEADTRSGRMSAESRDEERIYKDRQAITGEKSDLAGDKPGSLQERSDRNAVQREQANLKADTNTWAADARSGKMAAESTDAEKIYKDQQAIKGEKSTITSDRAKLNGDRKN
jgi:hypothetical protein